MIPPPPRSTLFPYTTLFRSTPAGGTFSWAPGGQTTSAVTVNPLISTTYTVTYTVNGCVATSTATVTPLPTVTNTSDRKSTRLNSSHGYISYAVFCLKKKKKK